MARHDEATLPASGSGRLLLLVEMLNNEEEDRRTAQGGAAGQIRRFPNRTETRGSNNQTALWLRAMRNTQPGA